MKRNRDFHRQVRVIYRACRRKHGTDFTEDEALKLFKVVFPEFYRIWVKFATDDYMNEHNVIVDIIKNDINGIDFGAAFESVPMDVRNNLYQIVRSWRATGELNNIIERATSYIDIPMDAPARDIAQFYIDILPVVMRIRKLSNVECFRLMAVSESDIDTMMNSGLSKSALYKLAGNSIVAGNGRVDGKGNREGVLFNIFRTMFVDAVEHKSKRPAEVRQLSLFD